MVLDFIIEKDKCVGALTRNNKGELKRYNADYTVLASGGIGGLYAFTSNDETITGDGLAMVYRAGGELVDLEFIQFHPTMLYAWALFWSCVRSCSRRRSCPCKWKRAAFYDGYTFRTGFSAS